MEKIHPESGPSITGPSITGPSIEGPSITGPSITGPSITGPSITGPSFEGPSITGLSIKGPSFKGPSFKGPSIKGPSIAGPSITGPSIAGPSITGPSITGPSITGPSIEGPSFVGPSFVGPSITGPSITGPSITGPSIEGPSCVGPSIVGPSESNTVQIHDTIQDGDRHRDTEDIFKLTPHVTIAFADTFKESSAIKGFSFMEHANEAIYTYTHFAFYAVTSLIIGPFLACSWATLFALMHICIVWFIQPFVKSIFICLRLCHLLYEPLLRLFCDPAFRSVSLIYSRIKGHVKMSSSDLVVSVKTTEV